MMKALFFFLSVVFLMKVTGGGGFAITLPFAFAALMQRKMEWNLFWIAVAISMVVGNSVLLPKDIVFMVSQRIMILTFGILMILQLGKSFHVPYIAPFFLMMPFIVFSILSSSFGWNPIISYLKLVLFFVTYMAYLGVAGQIVLHSRAQLPQLRAIVFVVIGFFVVGSILLIPFPAISQLTGEEYVNAVLHGQVVGSLFKGITFQSQALGAIVAICLVFLVADWVFAVRRRSYFHALLILLCPYLIFRTSSRTAIGSMIIGLCVIGHCLLRERGIGVKWRAKVKQVSFFIVLAILVAVTLMPSLRDRVVQYALKYDRQAKAEDFSLSDAVRTREGLFDEGIANFKKSPVIGNGFQVTEDMKHRKIKSIKDILSAPIEKGVWISAVLEEGGIIGFFLLLLFLFGGGYQLLMRRAYISLSLLGTLFALNFGEFSMFSMSSIGGFEWMFVFIGVAFDALRIRDDQYEPRW